MSTSTSSTSIIEGPHSCQFFTKTWSPSSEPRAAVLFVHGFVEHVVRYDHVFASFADQGIAVFAYDQRGFGETAAATKTHGHTSQKDQLLDISFFVSHASSLYPSIPLYLFGHSMGGGLVLAYATKSPKSPGLDKVKGVLASSPLLRQSPGVRSSLLIVRAGGLVGKLSGKLTMPAAVKPEDVCRDPVIQKAYAEDPLCVQVGSFRGISDMLLGGEALMKTGWKSWPKDLPLLIVHGEADKVTHCEASKEFVEKVQSAGAKDAEYKGFPGFYHEMHNEPEPDRWTEINYLSSWIKSKI